MTQQPPRDYQQVAAALRARREELRQVYGVKEIALLGSYVQGENRPDSDLDILVEFEQVPGLLKFLELEDYLSRLLGVPVDLVRKASLRPELKEAILQEAVPI